MLLLYFLSKYLFDLTFVNKYSNNSLLTGVVWNKESITNYSKVWTKHTCIYLRNLFSF